MKSTQAQWLTDQVRDVLRDSFSAMIATHPDETFYTFALYTDSALNFLAPAANTEEGLALASKRYCEVNDTTCDLSEAIDELRWAYEQWMLFPHEHNVYDDFFESVNDVISGLSPDSLDPSLDFEDEFESYWEAILDGFLALEKEGFFGVGKEREKITLLIVGNISGETFDHWVRTLNPPAIVDNILGTEPED